MKAKDWDTFRDQVLSGRISPRRGLAAALRLPGPGPERLRLSVPVRLRGCGQNARLGGRGRRAVRLPQPAVRFLGPREVPLLRAGVRLRQAEAAGDERQLTTTSDRSGMTDTLTTSQTQCYTI
jgi:hypothetical protein